MIALHLQSDFNVRFKWKECFSVCLYQIFSYIPDITLFFFEVFTT
jgi:hypothetical protein